MRWERRGWERTVWVRGPERGPERGCRQANFEEATLPAATLDQRAAGLCPGAQRWLLARCHTTL